MTAADVEALGEIDATVQSSRYLHVAQTGEGFAMSWKVEERELREPRAETNRLSEDGLFLYRQVAGGIEDGVAVVTEREGQVLASLLAVPVVERKVMRLVDVRVDYDYRREGFGTAMWYTAMQVAREGGMRAVLAELTSDNLLGASFLRKLGFRLGGVDTLRMTNHDLVKERATLVWYFPLE